MISRVSKFFSEYRLATTYFDQKDLIKPIYHIRTGFWGIFDFHPGYDVIDTGLNDQSNIKVFSEYRLATTYSGLKKSI